VRWHRQGRGGRGETSEGQDGAGEGREGSELHLSCPGKGRGGSKVVSLLTALEPAKPKTIMPAGVASLQNCRLDHLCPLQHSLPPFRYVCSLSHLFTCLNVPPHPVPLSTSPILRLDHFVQSPLHSLPPLLCCNLSASSFASLCLSQYPPFHIPPPPIHLIPLQPLGWTISSLRLTAALTSTDTLQVYVGAAFASLSPVPHAAMCSSLPPPHLKVHSLALRGFPVISVIHILACRGISWSRHVNGA
jgi:hypothetical protein